MKIVYPTSKEFESYFAHKGPSNTWTPQYTYHTPNSTHDIQWEATYLQTHKALQVLYHHKVSNKRIHKSHLSY
jgi:hypothetical protein